MLLCTEPQKRDCEPPSRSTHDQQDTESSSKLVVLGIGIAQNLSLHKNDTESFHFLLRIEVDQIFSYLREYKHGQGLENPNLSLWKE